MIRAFHGLAAAIAILLASASLAGPVQGTDGASFGITPAMHPPAAARTAAHPMALDLASCVTVAAGKRICGGEGLRATYSYLGIRFARADRWQPPRAEPVAAGDTHAILYPRACPQRGIDLHPLDAEDCLFLNIWRPRAAIDPSHPLPVMVYIFGGAFAFGNMGSALNPNLDGSALAAHGAVLVTINYRVGALGFLVANHKGTVTEGNLGLLDQQEALRWVHDHIAHFGGDPRNITLFGESAGAMSVGLHVFDIPSSEPLFQKAIMESNLLGQYYLPNHAADGSPSADKIGAQFLDYLCKQVHSGHEQLCIGDWAKHVSASDIIAVQNGFPSQDDYVSDVRAKLITLRSLTWQPSVDGRFIKGEPYDGYYAENGNRLPAKPLVFGVNKDEGVTLALTVAAKLGTGDVLHDPDAAAYNLLVDHSFNEPTAQRIKGNPSYNGFLPGSQNGGNGAHYYSDYGQAIANLFGDFSVVCASYKVAMLAINHPAAAPVYVYYFSHEPFFDLNNPVPIGTPLDHGACMPGSGNVCHAAEVPYVFDTLNLIQFQSLDHYIPRQSDRTLADEMGRAWVAFARDSQAAEGWTKFTNIHLVRRFAVSETHEDMVVDIDTVNPGSRRCSIAWLLSSAYSAP